MTTTAGTIVQAVMAEMRKKSEITVLVLLVEVLREKETEDTTRDHARAEEVGNGIPDHQEAEESEHDEEEEEESEHCAFLSEFVVAKVVVGDENGFSADLLCSIDVTADRLVAEDKADVETLCCASPVEICG